jgi:hypothetical protein
LNFLRNRLNRTFYEFINTSFRRLKRETRRRGAFSVYWGDLNTFALAGAS